jgi:hypothetical protein
MRRFTSIADIGITSIPMLPTGVQTFAPFSGRYGKMRHSCTRKGYSEPLKVADMSLGRHVQLTLRTFNLVTDQARIFMSALS